MVSHISSLLSHGAHLKGHGPQRQEEGRDCLGSHKWAQDRGLAKAPFTPCYAPLSRTGWQAATHLQGTLACALSPMSRNRKMWLGGHLASFCHRLYLSYPNIHWTPHKHENTHVLSKGVNIMVIYSMNQLPARWCIVFSSYKTANISLSSYFPYNT